MLSDNYSIYNHKNRCNLTLLNTAITRNKHLCLCNTIQWKNNELRISYRKPLQSAVITFRGAWVRLCVISKVSMLDLFLSFTSLLELFSLFCKIITPSLCCKKCWYSIFVCFVIDLRTIHWIIHKDITNTQVFKSILVCHLRFYETVKMLTAIGFRGRWW